MGTRSNQGEWIGETQKAIQREGGSMDERESRRREGVYSNNTRQNLGELGTRGRRTSNEGESV